MGWQLWGVTLVALLQLLMARCPHHKNTNKINAFAGSLSRGHIQRVVRLFLTWGNAHREAQEYWSEQFADHPPVWLVLGMGTFCTSDCKSCFEINSLMIEARGDVAVCLRQTSRLMRCEEWFGHSSLHLFFFFCFPYFCRPISVSPQAPWLHSYSTPSLPPSTVMLPSNVENYFTYLILQPARAGLFCEEIPTCLGKWMLAHKMSGKDAGWDSGCKTPVEWILYHKDAMLQERELLLQVKWKSLVVYILGWNSNCLC